MRIETVKRYDFLTNELVEVKNDGAIIKHFKDNKGFYMKVAGITFTVCIGIDATAFASTGLDAGATKLYSKLVGVGKWVIIVKGGIDTITQTLQGDFQTAKKSFLSYLVIYLILLGLPWAMNEVENMFSELQ